MQRHIFEFNLHCGLKVAIAFIITKHFLIKAVKREFPSIPHYTYAGHVNGAVTDSSGSWKLVQCSLGHMPGCIPRCFCCVLWLISALFSILGWWVLLHLRCLVSAYEVPRCVAPVLRETLWPRWAAAVAWPLCHPFRSLEIILNNGCCSSVGILLLSSKFIVKSQMYGPEERVLRLVPTALASSWVEASGQGGDWVGGRVGPCKL